MLLRDITSVALATTLLVICVFGVLFLFASQCFTADTPRSAVLAPTATRQPAQGSDDGGQAVTTDEVPATATTVSTNTPRPASTATALAAAPATSTPNPPGPAQQPPASTGAAANFSGSWLVVDTVTTGNGAGQTFSFEVTLTQSGNSLSGGNSGIQMSGVVSGATATLTYVQPALGLTGTFNWTMSGGAASGTFTSSVPNAGTSQLVRR
jgi:hypothetical protein